MLIKKPSCIKFDRPSRVFIVDVVSTDIGKIGEVGATVDDMLTISKLGVQSGRVTRSDNTASHGEVLDQPIAEGTVSWHVDADTSACCLAQRLHVKRQRRPAQEPESALAPEDRHRTAANLSGETQAESTVYIRV